MNLLERRNIIYTKQPGSQEKRKEQICKHVKPYYFLHLLNGNTLKRDTKKQKGCTTEASRPLEICWRVFMKIYIGSK